MKNEDDVNEDSRDGERQMFLEILKEVQRKQPHLNISKGVWCWLAMRILKQLFFFNNLPKRVSFCQEKKSLHKQFI